MTTPPVAKKVPKIDVLHGDIRQDDYYWLREKDDPEVLAYLRAENAYTDGVMKPQESFQETLYQEMLARIKEDDSSVPYRRARTSITPARSAASSTRSTAARPAAWKRPKRSCSISTSWPRGIRSSPSARLRSATMAISWPTRPPSPAFASTRCTSRTCARASSCPAPSSAWPPWSGPPTT